MHILYVLKFLIYRGLANLFYPALIFSLLFLNNVFADPYQYVGNPVTQVFSIEEHQSSNQIWSVDQYIDGRTLFATGNGLSSWDGENWQRSSTPNNTRIRDITVWHDTRVYAGSVGELGYFSLTNTGEFEFTLIATEHLLKDFGQTLGVNSNKNMYSMDIVNGEPVATPLPWQFPANMRIKSVFLNQQHKIVLVTNMQGVFQLENDTFVQQISPNELPINFLSSGIQGTDGFYYLTSSIDGLMIFDASFTLMRHYKQCDGLGLSTIYNIFQDDQQNIWLAGLPNISVFQPPHIRSQYTSDTGTVDFENIYNIEQSMFFSGTGFYQLTFPNGKTRSPPLPKSPI